MPSRKYSKLPARESEESEAYIHSDENEPQESSFVELSETKEGSTEALTNDTSRFLPDGQNDEHNRGDEEETSENSLGHQILDDSSSPSRDAPDASFDDVVLTVDEAIERLGMGRFQLVILTASGLCFAADAMQVVLLSFLSEVLRSEWDRTDTETAMITSILFVGAIFGTLTLGPLADSIGRKPVFLTAATIIGCFGVVVSTVQSYKGLLVALFLVGWGIGGLTVPFDILAECLPSNARGKNLLVIEYFWTVGVLFVVCVAYGTLGNGASTTCNWRLFVFICTIPCWASIGIGFWFVPESPRWLCSQGRSEEAITILRMAAISNGHEVDFLYPEGMQLVGETEEIESSNDFCELFSPKWRWTILKLWGAWGFFAFGYYGTMMAITEIFDSQDGDNGSENNFDYGAIFVSSSAELFGTTIAIFAVDTLGRIPLQVVAYAIAGILVCALYLSAANDGQRTILIGLGFGARIFEMTGSCVSWVSTAEILTTEVRTTGHASANAIARIGSLSSPFLIEGHASFVKKGFFMLAIHFATVFFVAQLPETKGLRLGIGQEEGPSTHGGEDDNTPDVFRDEEVDETIIDPNEE